MLYYRVICIKLLLNGMLSAWLANSLHAIQVHIVSALCVCAAERRRKRARAQEYGRIGQPTAHSHGSRLSRMNEFECK